MGLTTMIERKNTVMAARQDNAVLVEPMKAKLMVETVKAMFRL